MRHLLAVRLSKNPTPPKRSKIKFFINSGLCNQAGEFSMMSWKSRFGLNWQEFHRLFLTQVSGFLTDCWLRQLVTDES
jgi:hypothetical protein